MKGIIAVINQKGGVGKSTTALAIGSGLLIRKQRILFIDLDAQGNLSFTLEADHKDKTILELLTGEIGIDQAIHKTGQADIIPASPLLATLESNIKNNGLKNALQSIKDHYDYVIIDTPPNLGILTFIAMLTATEIIIPAQADIYSLQGIVQLFHNIQAVRKQANPGLKVKGIVLTRFNSRTILSRDIADQLEAFAKKMDTRLFKTKIRECIAVKEAQINRQSIFTYAKKSNASQDYRALIGEILKEG